MSRFRVDIFWYFVSRPWCPLYVDALNTNGIHAVFRASESVSFQLLTSFEERHSSGKFCSLIKWYSALGTEKHSAVKVSRFRLDIFWYFVSRPWCPLYVNALNTNGVDAVFRVSEKGFIPTHKFVWRATLFWKIPFLAKCHSCDSQLILSTLFRRKTLLCDCFTLLNPCQILQFIILCNRRKNIAALPVSVATDERAVWFHLAGWVRGGFENSDSLFLFKQRIQLIEGSRIRLEDSDSAEDSARGFGFAEDSDSFEDSRIRWGFGDSQPFRSTFEDSDSDSLTLLEVLLRIRIRIRWHF